MASLRNYKLTIKAGEKIEFGLRGSMVRIVSSSVPLYFASRNDDANFYLVEGEEARLEGGAIFTALDIWHDSGAEQSVVLAVGENAYMGSARVSGSVTVSNKDATNGAFTQGRASVTNVNQVLIAANAERRYLLIQNNSTTAVLRVKLDGSAATSVAGFRVTQGAVLEIPNYAVTGAINCMMETADGTAANVEFVTG